MKNTILYITTILTFFLISSCNTIKKTTGSTKAISVKKVIKSYQKNEFSKETVQAKIKLHFENAKTSQNISIKLRLKKDEIIWMSGSVLGFPVAKVKITPTSVQYYEKITKTYFDGDFSFVNNALGAELDFYQLQNLFFGQAVTGLSDEKYNQETTATAYVLTPKNQHSVYSIFYWINPTIFKLDKQELQNLQQEQNLRILYPDYYNISGEYFPKSTTIIVQDNKNTTTIEMNYKSVEFDKKLSFPFTIPSGYKRIELTNF